MSDRFRWILSLLLLLLAIGCSDQKVPVTAGHPNGFALAHRSVGSQPDDCTACHGVDLRGGSVGVSCFRCHAEGPPFQIHPAAWADPRQAHQTFAAQGFGWTLCANPVCHGPDLKGGGQGATKTGPSCFSASFTPAGGASASCHSGGPPAPHDVPFTAPEVHGAQAKANQLFCRLCHGRPPNDFDGGFVGDPAIRNRPNGVCSASACHPAAKAHPTDWQGSNDPDLTYAASHRRVSQATVDASCALCHRTTGPGEGPRPGAPSCFSRSHTNADGATTGCHPDGPGTPPHVLPFLDPALHGPNAKDRFHFCQQCHGVPGTTLFDGGRALTACSADGCHPAAGAHPTNWQGSDDPTPDYLSSHRTIQQATIGTECTLCHNTTSANPGPNPAAPGCLSPNFTNSEGSFSGCHASGPGTAPHAIPFAPPNLHGPEAKKGFDFCQGCHGTPGTTRFDGGVVDVRCSACHTSAGAHPTDWQGSNDTTLDYLSTHRNIDLSTAAQSCGICHNTASAAAGPNPGAPSCFSANHQNADGSTTGCHPNGPGSVPHALPYTQGSVHGPEAKKSQRFCQTCHGTPGTTAFDGGVVPVACSAQTCHPDAGAHPTNWQGTDGPTSHRTAGDLVASCIICHNTTKNAPGPKPGAPSCLSASFQNPDGANSLCHPNGPGAPHDLPYADPALHGANAKADLAFCQGCHGNPGTTAFNGGVAQTQCSAVACHPDAGAHPAQWQGTNDPTPSYLSNHRTSGNQGTGCVLCHDVIKGRAAPNAAAPSCFSATFQNPDGTLSGCHVNGPGAPHALPFAPAPVGNVSASLHGAEAKKDLTFCQQCHATPFNGGPGSNPRFNVLLGRLSTAAGRTGCEICHNDKTAHPVPWAVGVIADHKEFGNKQVACALCHGANLLGAGDTPAGVGPACTTCHKVNPLTVTVACTSCHSAPPSGPNTLDNRPNRQGAHGPIHDALPRMDCNACHNGAGTGTAKHFDRAAPADNAFLAVYNAKTGTATKNDGTVAGRPASTCSNVSCHGGVITPNWYTETINRATDCTRCHVTGTAAQSPQFNSPYSGQHRVGSHVSNGCTSCHDPAKLEPAATRHYSGLDTPVFETDAETTIRTALNYVPTSQIPPRGSCNPSAGGLTGCHGSHSW
jgi:predicted CxxxxCH...CXXCH cytochrome family protein